MVAEHGTGRAPCEQFLPIEGSWRRVVRLGTSRATTSAEAGAENGQPSALLLSHTQSLWPSLGGDRQRRLLATEKGGWRYLTRRLEQKRGKEKVEVLGDAFSDVFAKRGSQRKPGEDLADYDLRVKGLVRKFDKAIKDFGSEGKMPQELLYMDGVCFTCA